MLLAIDIGNTNIVLGVFDGDNLLCNARITTKVSRTSDEYGILLRDIISSQNVDPDNITEVIISSVVPGVMYSFTSGSIKYFDCEPLIVDSDVKTGLKFNSLNPREIGSDRIVDCVAAYKKYNGPVIITDFGTATTYDLVDKEGTFICGITCLGLRSASKALHAMTAQLPDFAISKPDNILATDTISSLQAGLVYGAIGQTEYIINEIKKTSGCMDAKVVATGGLARLIYNETNIIDIYDKDLTLHGLRYINQLNKND